MSGQIPSVLETVIVMVGQAVLPAALAVVLMVVTGLVVLEAEVRVEKVLAVVVREREWWCRFAREVGRTLWWVLLGKLV